MSSIIIIKNKFSRVESPVPAEVWQRLGTNSKKAFVIVDEIIEPPEVTDLKKRLTEKKEQF